MSLDRSPESNHARPLTDIDAARYLGVAVQTLRNWRHTRRGPSYVKLSPGPRGRVVYRTEDLDAYMDLCRIDPAGGQE